MYQVAMERMGCTSSQTIVIGDRLETDIAGGEELNCHTALVLSGVTSEETAKDWNPPPDLITSDLTQLLELFAEHR
jgi:4-nitrophenyl phosphatase